MFLGMLSPMVMSVLLYLFTLLSRGSSMLYENALEVKKSKCENYIKFGPKIWRMMRGFQIWPQN